MGEIRRIYLHTWPQGQKQNQIGESRQRFAMMGFVVRHPHWKGCRKRRHGALCNARSMPLSYILMLFSQKPNIWLFDWGDCWWNYRAWIFFNLRLKRLLSHVLSMCLLLSAELGCQLMYTLQFERALSISVQTKVCISSIGQPRPWASLSRRRAGT